MARKEDHCTDAASFCPKEVMLKRHRARPSLNTGRDSHQACCIRQVIADDKAPPRQCGIAVRNLHRRPNWFKLSQGATDSRPTRWANSMATQWRRKCCAKCYSDSS